MWTTISDYLKQINEDSEKYFEFDSNTLKVTPDMLPLDLDLYFKNENTIKKLEIGFGNGDSLIKLAQRNPHINYFGIDKKMDRVRISLKKMRRIEKIPNLLITRLGTDFITDMFKPRYFDEIIMNFPDPWPKKKHHKNRTINNSFLGKIHSLLNENGIFRFASDHEEYSLEVIELFNNSKLFSNLYSPYHYKREMKNRIQTQFEKHKIKEGFKIYYTKYKKI